MSNTYSRLKILPAEGSKYKEIIPKNVSVIRLFEIPYEAQTIIQAFLTEESKTEYEKNLMEVVICAKKETSSATLPQKTKPLPPNQKEKEACKFIWGPGFNEGRFKFYGWRNGAKMPFSKLNDDRDIQEIKTNYTFASQIIFEPKILTLGRPIWLEAFTTVPLLINNYSLAGAYVVMVAEKPTVNISLRHLHIHSTCEETTLNEDKDEYAYGEGVLLHIIMHSSTKNLSNDYLDITIESGSFKKTIAIKNKLEKDPNSFGYNKLYSQYLHLSEGWKKKTEHEEGTKEYTITANWHSGVLQNYDNEAGEKYKRQQQSTNYNPIDNTSNSVNIRNSVVKFQVDTQVIGKKTIKLVLEKPAEDTREWGEQIAKVGHTPEQTQCFEPCHYTAITLTEALDKGEKRSVDLLNENKDGSLYNQTRKVFEIIAGTSKNQKKVEVILEALTNKGCLLELEGKEVHNITSINLKQRIDDKITLVPHEIKGGKIDIKALSKMSNFWNIASPLPPIKYIWPKATDPVVYVLDLATCRYQREIVLEVYPDIKWELGFTFSLENPLAYTHSGKKPGPIFQKAQKKAIQSGYDRYALSKGREVPAEFSLSLKAQWDKKDGGGYSFENECALEWARKISDTLSILQKLKNMADKVKTKAGGKAKLLTNNPFSFEIQSPVLGATAEWQLEEIEDHRIATVGTLSLSADPLIGAEFTIDMLAVAANMNPIVLVIKKGLDIALDFLGGYMTLEATFYGNLNITIEALEFNSVTKKISVGDTPMKIDGRMGITVSFKLLVDGTIKNPVFEAEMKFSADAKADAFFGGTIQMGIDDNGTYGEITGKFSGLVFSAEVEIIVGGWKRVKKFESEPIFESENIPLGKMYFIGGEN